jgi:hypothetical protein
MAITASGLFYTTWRDLLNATQLAIDLDLDTHKVALFTDTVAPNFSTNTAYGVAPFNANEVSGAGYTAGGTALVGTAVDESPTGSLRWDATDTAWSAATFSNAEGALIYADVLAGDRAIVLVDFTAPYSVTAGTFTIQWATAGILAIDLTP